MTFALRVRFFLFAFLTYVDPLIRPQAGQANGTDAPVLLFGILSAVLLAGALLPQYWEIYRLGEVKGISMTFMAVDMAGGVFCILSLVFKESIDILATVSRAKVVAY